MHTQEILKVHLLYFAQDELEHQQALHQEAQTELDMSRRDKDKEETSLGTVAKDKEQMKVSIYGVHIRTQHTHSLSIDHCRQHNEVKSF